MPPLDPPFSELRHVCAALGLSSCHGVPHIKLTMVELLLPHVQHVVPGLQPLLLLLDVELMVTSLT